MKITSEQLEELRVIGACRGRLSCYSAGMDVSEIKWADAIWVEDNAPHLVAGFTPPLWTRCGYGYGYGDGDGYGDGYGYGYGYGDGDGYGNGDGYGDGYGYGYGNGNGYGYGYGDGSGAGHEP